MMPRRKTRSSARRRYWIDRTRRGSNAMPTNEATPTATATHTVHPKPHHRFAISRPPTTTSAPMSEPITSTTTYFGETRSQPLSTGASPAEGTEGTDSSLPCSTPCSTSCWCASGSGMRVPLLLGLVGRRQRAEVLRHEPACHEERRRDGASDRHPDGRRGGQHGAGQQEQRDADADAEHEGAAHAARLREHRHPHRAERVDARRVGALHGPPDGPGERDDE